MWVASLRVRAAAHGVGQRVAPVRWLGVAPAARATGTRTRSAAPPTVPAGTAAAWPGVDARVVAACVELGANAPTEAQQRALPALLAGGSVALTAATGTGKTLAYLAPVCTLLKRAEEADGVVPRTQRPRAVVLVPTRELALQTSAVAKMLAHHVKLRVVALVGGTRQALSRAALQGHVDIVIATPGRLALVHQQGHLFMTDVRHVVIDEADTLVDRASGFGTEVDAVLAPLQAARQRLARGGSVEAGDTAAGGRVQFILVGATLPPTALARIRRTFPDTTFLSTRDAHTFPASLRHEFVAVSGQPDAKHGALSTLLSRLRLPPTPKPFTPGVSDGRDGAATSTAVGVGGDRVLIFCNSIPSARSTAHHLAEAGVSAASLHGGIPPQRRTEEYRSFQQRRCHVLVCTDAAARGLDIPDATVVVNFDFPHTVVDYVHRAGRVARAGRVGVTVSLVGKRDADLANHVRAAAMSGRPVTLEATAVGGGRGSPSPSHRQTWHHPSDRPAGTGLRHALAARIRGASGRGGPTQPTAPPSSSSTLRGPLRGKRLVQGSQRRPPASRAAAGAAGGQRQVQRGVKPHTAHGKAGGRVRSSTPPHRNDDRPARHSNRAVPRSGASAAQRQ